MFPSTSCFLLWDLPAGTGAVSTRSLRPCALAREWGAGANSELEPSANTPLLAEPNFGGEPGS
jgi:hypothetical protein